MNNLPRNWYSVRHVQRVKLQRRLKREEWLGNVIGSGLLILFALSIWTAIVVFT